MNDLRAAVATALALGPASRLVTIDAGDLVEAGGRMVYAAVGSGATAEARGVIADPLRLPFVAALADRVLLAAAAGDDPAAKLREVWRILAPAGALVLIVPLPTSHSLKSLITRRIVRRRVARWLAAARFAAVASQTVAGRLIVRAEKRDGLAPQRRATAAVHAPAFA